MRILGSSGNTEKRPSLDVAVGDTVRITSGGFEDYTAKVTEIDEEKGRLKVLVGETPVDLDFGQAERV